MLFGLGLSDNSLSVINNGSEYGRINVGNYGGIEVRINSGK